MVVQIDPRLAKAPTQQALRGRLSQELELRGFVVRQRDLSGEEGVLPLEVVAGEIADRENTLGIVLTLSDAGHASLDVLHPRRTRSSHHSMGQFSGRSQVSELALAAAELVSASAMEPAATIPSAAVEPAPDVVPSAPKQAIVWHASAGVSVLWPVLHRVPDAVVTPAVGIRPWRRVALTLEAGLPLHGFRDRVELGEVRTHVFLVGARADLSLLNASAPVDLQLRAGASAIALRTKARTEADITTHAWSGAARLGLAVVRQFGRHMRVGGTLQTVTPFEALRVRARQETVQDLRGIWLMIGGEAAVRW